MPSSTKKTNRTHDPRKGDDRNLVIVDEDFGRLGFEDRLGLFWERNKTTVTTLFTLTIVGILAAIGWFALSDYRVSALQDDFQKRANTVEAKLAFARVNAGRPLAGVSALEAADSLYKDSKYAEAAEAYALARKSFALADKNSAAFAGRALLGFASAKFFGGDRSGAVAALTELARSPAYASAQRGEAFYNLALLALEKNEIAEARQWLNTMDRSIRPDSVWVSRKQELFLQFPSLIETPAPEKPAAPAAAVPPAAPETSPAPAAVPAAVPEKPAAPAAPATSPAPPPPPAPSAPPPAVATPPAPPAPAPEKPVTELSVK
ncbi:MAG: hypothetical protein LBS59_05200 [Puniceicoccales bacterium]|nr:hypothetical protein [Puniceicoccales bacterium]